MKEIISIIIVVGGIMASTASATNRHVVAAGTIANGKDVYPYNTWTNAATNIQWAVDAATNTETVWVSNGTYVLTNQIEITNAIILQGTNGQGFTVINGNFVAGSIAPTNNRCLVISNAGAFVSGFTISNGANIASDGGGVRMYSGILSNCAVINNNIFGAGRGGGICISVGTVTVCRVSDNTITSTTGSSGGGICDFDTGAPCVFKCVISNNLLTGATAANTAQGGGAYFEVGGIFRSNIVCNNSVESLGTGGGIVSAQGNLLVDACTITGNRANPDYRYGAGCQIRLGTITNCVISGNTGPGVSIYSPAVGYNCRVYNTTIANNTAGGVGISQSFVGSVDCLVDNCIITNNASFGVSMYYTNSSLFNSLVSGNNGPGVSCYNGKIRNCLIANNTDRGILIQSTCKTALVSSCTIVSNQGTTAGSGLRIEATNAAAARLITVSSCVIYSNGVGGADDVYDACAPTNYNALQYSCVGTNTGFAGAVIIVADPKFKDFAGGNYRLAANSPCINVGSNETWMTNAVDRDGRTRIRYGTVDMGVYERVNDGSVYGFR